MKTLFFRVEYPSNMDEAKVMAKLQAAADTIDVTVSQTSEGMAELEGTSETEREERHTAQKYSEKEIEDVGAEIERRVAKFSDEDLPSHVYYMPEEFRTAYKRTIATEQIEKERNSR